MVLRDALSPEGVSRNAAREDGDEPHPAAAGGLDIRVPIPDVDGVLPRHGYRHEDGVEGFGVGLGVAALPRAGRSKPPRLYAGGMKTVVSVWRSFVVHSATGICWRRNQSMVSRLPLTAG